MDKLRCVANFFVGAGVAGVLAASSIAFAANGSVLATFVTGCICLVAGVALWVGGAWGSRSKSPTPPTP